jgi:hypothetical protein
LNRPAKDSGNPPRFVCMTGPFITHLLIAA